MHTGEKSYLLYVAFVEIHFIPQGPCWYTHEHTRVNAPTAVNFVGRCLECIGYSCCSEGLTDKLPFPCSHCEKRFISKAPLDDMLIHTGEKPHPLIKLIGHSSGSCLVRTQHFFIDVHFQTLFDSLKAFVKFLVVFHLNIDSTTILYFL